MRFNVPALASTSALIWAVGIFLVAIANLMAPGYGRAFLDIFASVYPGYAPGGFGSVVIVTIYALADGFIWGAVFGWLYNAFAGRMFAPR
jgi:hypothetical protein